MADPDPGRLAKRLLLFDRMAGEHYRNVPLNHSGERRIAIQNGRGMPSLPELLTGAPFFKDDLHADLERFCKIVLRYEKILHAHFSQSGSYQLEHFNELLEEMRKDTEAGRGKISWISEQLYNLRQGGDLKRYQQAFAFAEFEGRIQFYEACSHNSHAQLRIAQLCLEATTLDYSKNVEVRAFKCALAWLRKSNIPRDGQDKPAELLSGPQMIIEGSSLLNGLGRRISSENVTRMFFLGSGDLRELPGSKSSGKVIPLVMDVKAAEDPPLADKPALVVFTEVTNTHSNLDERYKLLLGKPIRLVQPPDLACVRKSLLTEFPHAEKVIDRLLKDAGNRRDQTGKLWIKIRPTILVGTPGTGKSYFARRFADAMGLPQLFFSCAGVLDAMFGSTSKKWSSSSAALPVEKIAMAMVANPLIILDEIEKASTGRHNGSLTDVLLTMIESSTAEAYFDQSLGGPVNLSGVNWLSTANSIVGLSSPLRDRFRVLHFPAPSREHLSILLPAILKATSLQQNGDERWIRPFDQIEIEEISNAWKGGSIRGLKRIVEVVLDAREKFTPQIMS